MDDFAAEREAMVRRQLIERGIRSQRVLAAFRAVRRDRFVPVRYRALAYSDAPLPIGESQTISQPYIVAYMIEALDIMATDRVLEIGTGSGYAAAILGRLAQRVDTVERFEPLARRAKLALSAEGYDNVHVHMGDGSLGWPDEAPYDAILVSAAAPKIPETLVAQLAPGGRLIVPVGTLHGGQDVILATKRGRKLVEKRLVPVRFVPLVGEKGWQTG